MSLRSHTATTSVKAMQMERLSLKSVLISNTMVVAIKFQLATDSSLRTGQCGQHGCECDRRAPYEFDLYNTETLAKTCDRPFSTQNK
ncbi:hypothetical protein DPMN_138359 [Dreissena polymorpha]|uniref:Uncharacterized protein n=1 Tax=Dreissena polymorpha TaxID=45954 RepID=A0A9D4JJR4_DREPO|nr:hypothetical protein DPMN_138359 [Dreissena polymorpha]